MKRQVICQFTLAALLAVHSVLMGQAQDLPSHVTINSNYPENIVFRASLFGTDTTQTTGRVPPGFAPRRQAFSGSVDFWFAGMDGRFRIYQSKGKLEVHETAGGKTQAKPVQTGGRIEFDALGYPKNPPSDPADLIPIFPSKPVAAGDHWTATAQITEPLGTGEALYTYTVQSISLAENHHILASIQFTISGDLTPPSGLPGWTSTLTGSGRLDWDCVEHQRAAASYRIVYAARKHGAGITETRELTESVTRVK
ncbi:MAG TPA: hypothetical protein VMX16_13805 [Terriglobia bacterium]|nr:hypothetical protein [Terriglobia bacterium]